ncbi:MAG: hypothetical protein Kow00127_00530 [Bacteroidales bacterium]
MKNIFKSLKKADFLSFSNTRIVLPVFILLFSVNAIGNSSSEAFLIDITEDASYRFVWTGTTIAAENLDADNYFIRELSRHNLTSLRKTSFYYHYTTSRKLKQLDPWTYHVTFALHEKDCTGDNQYRGFLISDILVPEYASFDVVVEHNGNYYHRQHFDNVQKDSNGDFNVSFIFESNVKEPSWNMIVENLTFDSQESDKEEFNNRISNIDDYYAALGVMDSLNAWISALNFTPANIAESFVKVSEYNRVLNRIKDAGFNRMLAMYPEKQKEFSAGYSKLQQRLEESTDRMNVVIDSQDYIRLHDDISTIAHHYALEASKFVELSDRVTHSDQHFYYFLGASAYSSSDFAAMQSGMFRILQKTRHCNDTDLVFDQLKREVYRAFLEYAEKLFVEERYYIAKGVLENASRFYSTIISDQIPLDLTQRISRAKYGIFNSYLHLIDRAIDIGNYLLAENYIEKARMFQAENSSSIISVDFIREKSVELVDLYINKGFNLINEEGWRDAVYCFEQAQRLCDRMGRYNHDYIIKHGLIRSRNGLYRSLLSQASQDLEIGEEMKAREKLDEAKALAGNYPAQIEPLPLYNSIDSAITHHVYLRAIADGRKMMAAGNYSQAYRYFLTALELEEQADISVYEPLTDLFASAATPYLIDLCDLAEVKLHKSQMDKAREIYDQVFQLQADYGLNYEPELQSALARLNNNIFLKQCELAGDAVDEFVNQSENLAEAGDFVRAVERLQLADSIARANYYCSIDMQEVDLLTARYEPAAEYQKLATLAQQALQNNDRARFTEIYKRMEILSDNYEVIRTRIEPMPLHYLFSVKKNLAFLENSINTYENEEELATALKILHVLQANNYSGKETRSIQESLARRLAYADKLDGDSADPHQEVEKYTEGKSWYKHFKKAYLREW